MSKSSAATGEEFHLGDTTIADLGEAENRLIRRYFEITRRDTNANSTQNRLIRAGYFAAGAVTTFRWFVRWSVSACWSRRSGL